MFNRDTRGYLDNLDISTDMHRFEFDAYLTKYLVKCYNPEFKMRMVAMKDTPHLSIRGPIDANKRDFSRKEEVL